MGAPIPELSNNNRNGKGILSQDRLERMLQGGEMPSIAKELVHPGIDPLELLMRTYLKSDKEINAAVNYLSKCREFGDKEGEQVLLMKLSARVSLNGMSRDQMVMVMVGQLYARKPEVKSDKKESQKDAL